MPLAWVVSLEHSTGGLLEQKRASRGSPGVACWCNHRMPDRMPGISCELHCGTCYTLHCWLNSIQHITAPLGAHGLSDVAHSACVIDYAYVHAGLAAGFDKHGEVISPLMQLGFGFVEIGKQALL